MDDLVGGDDRDILPRPHPMRIPVSSACAGAVVAGGALGLADALGVLVRGGMSPDTGDRVALCALGACAGAGLALPGAVLARGASSVAEARARGAIGGAWGLGAVALALAWFTDPAPFTQGLPAQGSVPVFVAMLGVGAVALAGALRACRAARGRRVLVVGVAAAALGVAVAPATATSGVPVPVAVAPSRRPNVLLVTLDTARADRFGCYGGTADTRHVDRLAREGVRFAQAYGVAPVTGPSHASMLLGAGPWDHGVLLNGVPLPTDRPTLAELLAAHGWRTGAFVSAYVLDGALGFRRGFEVYDDSFAWLPGSDRLLAGRLRGAVARRAGAAEPLERRGADTVDAALRWLEGQRAPWFLWVHLFDPHGPYAPPPPWDTRYVSGDPTDPANPSMRQVGELPAYMRDSLRGITDVGWVRAQYDGEISYADSQLGRLLGALDSRGEAADTLVAVLADHGESLGEHGTWFTHGDDVARASVHVPFVLRGPGVPAGGVSDSPVEGSDLAPTLLARLGLAVPARMTGRDALASLLSGRGDIPPQRPPDVAARALCFDRASNRAGRAAGTLSRPRWRIAGLHAADGHLQHREVDHSDGWEGAIPTSPEAWQARARAVLDGADTDRSAAEVDVDTRARLEALGYVDPTAPAAPW
jgi:arylsulfatase A-like enzyme